MTPAREQVAMSICDKDGATECVCRDVGFEPVTCAGYLKQADAAIACLEALGWKKETKE